MKKFFVLLMTVLFLSGANFVFAREVENGKWEVSLQSGGVFPKDDDIDSTLYIGGRAIQEFNKYLGVGVESGWMSWEDSTNGVHYGDIRAFPLLADVVLKYPIPATENTVVPYAIAGVGVVFWDYDEDDILTRNGITVDSDTTFAARLGGGIDYFVNDQWAVFVEGSYLFSEYEADIKAAGLVIAGTVDTDAAFVTGGIKYRF